MKEKIIKTLESELDTAWVDNGHLVYVIYDGDIPDVASKIEPLINQEVELRIEERMPSEEEIMRRVRNRKDFLRELGYPTQVLVKYGDAIIETIEWLRSRLTNPGVNSSQKTEGGGE